jgi:triphosphatase
MPNEIELKLRINAADEQKLNHHPAIRQRLVGEPVTRALISIYYDTPELALLDAGLSLRVRSMSGGWFQAVKSAGTSVGGLHQRLEWEDLLTKNEPNFNKITEPHLAHIFANQSLRDALKPIFIVDVMRTDWQLKYADGTEIEVSLDLGELKVGELNTPQSRTWQRIEPINELEIELKHGNTSHLFELALALQTDIPFIIENISKAQRGYACLRAQPTIKTHAQATRIPVKNQTPHELVVDCLTQIQANQEILQKVNHTASVSQMRSAIYRMANILELQKPRNDFLLAELDWLNRFLVTPCDNNHYAQLQTAFNSQRYQRLLLRLGAWLHAEK